MLARVAHPAATFVQTQVRKYEGLTSIATDSYEYMAVRSRSVGRCRQTRKQRDPDTTTRRVRFRGPCDCTEPAGRGHGRYVQVVQKAIAGGASHQPDAYGGRCRAGVSVSILTPVLALPDANWRPRSACAVVEMEVLLEESSSPQWHTVRLLKDALPTTGELPNAVSLLIQTVNRTVVPMMETYPRNNATGIGAPSSDASAVPFIPRALMRAPAR